MTTITTEKRGVAGLENYEIYVNGTYFGTWFGHDENDAIRFASRNIVTGVNE